MSGEPLSRDELVENIRRPLLRPTRRRVLSSLLSRLRRVLGPEALRGRSRVELRLPPPVWIDVEAARVAVQSAREALAASEWAQLVEHCRLALDILERGFLPGHEAPWIDACRRDLEDLQLAELELEGRGGLALGGPVGLGHSERAAKSLIAIAPFREVGHRLLMETLERSGNGAEALQVYERLRVLLRDELGTTPARELRTLHERLLTAPAPNGATPSPPVPPSSAGTRPVTTAPPAAGVFVGRDRELAELEELRCSGSRGLIPVAGEPGIGKTRLVFEFVRRAEAEGALVLYRRCDEETLVP